MKTLGGLEILSLYRKFPRKGRKRGRRIIITPRSPILKRLMLDIVNDVTVRPPFYKTTPSVMKLITDSWIVSCGFSISISDFPAFLGHKLFISRIGHFTESSSKAAQPLVRSDDNNSQEDEQLNNWYCSEKTTLHILGIGKAPFDSA